MLASVDVLSRPDDQLGENTEGPTPNADCPTKFVRCGMDPARSRESKAALLPLVESPISPRLGDGDLYGLADGVGREVLEIMEGIALSPLMGPPGENLDGTVPARARRV